MQTSHAGLIRGLSITIVVITLLCILLLGALLAFFGLVVTMMDNPDMRNQMTYELVLNPNEMQTLDALGIPASDPALLVEWIIQRLGVVVGVLTAAHVIVLIAGIIGIRGARRAEKLGALFVWMIVAAIASLVGCNPVLLGAVDYHRGSRCWRAQGRRGNRSWRAAPPIDSRCVLAKRHPARGHLLAHPSHLHHSNGASPRGRVDCRAYDKRGRFPCPIPPPAPAASSPSSTATRSCTARFMPCLRP